MNFISKNNYLIRVVSALLTIFLWYLAYASYISDKGIDVIIILIVFGFCLGLVSTSEFIAHFDFQSGLLYKRYKTYGIQLYNKPHQLIEFKALVLCKILVAGSKRKVQYEMFLVKQNSYNNWRGKAESLRNSSALSLSSSDNRGIEVNHFNYKEIRKNTKNAEQLAKRLQIELIDLINKK